ncbi:MAG: hypothetical protein JWP76_5266 [Dactylosporangium sp.]|jgi:hypothetical protein|nr:hypothetical protein [Dactylosporangium sp.]
MGLRTLVNCYRIAARQKMLIATSLNEFVRHKLDASDWPPIAGPPVAGSAATVSDPFGLGRSLTAVVSASRNSAGERAARCRTSPVALNPWLPHVWRLCGVKQSRDLDAADFPPRR